MAVSFLAPLGLDLLVLKSSPEATGVCALTIGTVSVCEPWAPGVKALLGFERRGLELLLPTTLLRVCWGGSGFWVVSPLP